MTNANATEPWSLLLLELLQDGAAGRLDLLDLTSLETRVTGVRNLREPARRETRKHFQKQSGATKNTTHQLLRGSPVKSLAVPLELFSFRSMNAFWWLSRTSSHTAADAF